MDDFFYYWVEGGYFVLHEPQPPTFYTIKSVVLSNPSRITEVPITPYHFFWTNNPFNNVDLQNFFFEEDLIKALPADGIEDVNNWVSINVQKNFIYRTSIIGIIEHEVYAVTGEADEGATATIEVERFIKSHDEYEPKEGTVLFEHTVSEIIYLGINLLEDKGYKIKFKDTAGKEGTVISTFEKVFDEEKDFFRNVGTPRIDWPYFSLVPNPIYGSSVSFKSRLNYLSTIDNSLKILPSSENNLISQFNFKWLLNQRDLGGLLKNIENAGGYRNLKFNDPSNMYKDIIGLVENYSVNKSDQSLNETNITINVYSKVPIFNWKTSSFLNLPKNLEYSSFKSYKKYEFVYFDPEKYNPNYKGEKNKIDNFWFAKENIDVTGNSKFDTKKWTKMFNHDSKLPFDLNNKFDFYQMDYKNSYIQNIKHKENSNALKQFQFKIENISDIQCRSILFFLEKKCGYRRFIYPFPFMFSKYKVFICTEWNHVFKYYNCNDITATFVEDVNVNSNNFKYIDYDFYPSSRFRPYPEFLTSL